MEDISHKKYVQALLKLKSLNTQIALSKDEVKDLSLIIELYENKKFPHTLPTLIDSIKNRMLEVGINNKDLALLLDTTPSRISEYLNNKRMITLEVARKLYLILDIDPEIILSDKNI